MILAHVQCIAECTSSPIINSQPTELIHLYKVIWTVISHLVLHNSGALLNHSNHSVKPAWHVAAGLCSIPNHPCNCGPACFQAGSLQTTLHFKQPLQQLNYSCSFKTQQKPIILQQDGNQQYQLC